MAIDDKTLKNYINDPSDHFESPRKVLDHDELTTEQKRSILLSWQLGEEALSRATDESMGKTDGTLLPQVNAALSELDE